MYYTSDLEYMRRELKFSLSTIDYIQKRYGEELTDSQRSRIMYLLKTLKELNIDVKYINQNPEILNCIDVYTDEEFLSIIEYIKKMAKKKSLNTILAIIIASQEIVKNNRQEEVEKIIALLEKEGLADILDNREVNANILKDGNYLVIYKNLNILAQVKTYRNIIRKNPEIIYKGTTYDIQKIVEKIKKVNESEKEEVKKQDDINDVEDTVSKDENINNDYSEELDNGQILMGSEDNVQKVVIALEKYKIPYNIIFVNPEICKRKNISEVERILKILYDNNIPFNILDYSPQILQVGKSKGILEIITYLKSQNINLDILSVCPDILIKSNMKKIQSVLDILDKEKINRHIIYSCPQILISGNKKILLDIKNEIETTVPDINIILDMAPYVFVEKISNMYNILDSNNYLESVDRKYLSNSTRIVIVKNVDESQKVINVLRDKDMKFELIKKEPKVLTKTTAKQVKDILNVAETVGLHKDVIEKSPDLLVYSSAIGIMETSNKIKEYRPLKYNVIINSEPDVFIKSDEKKIESIMRIFEEEKLDYTIIDENPKILTREDEEEIGKVSRKLKEKGYTIKQINETPKILIEGKEKYIERNEIVLKRNKLELPLTVSHAMKTRKLEKNIDALIENGLYGQITNKPEILEMDDIKLRERIALAKIYSVPLTVKKEINMDYFNSEEEELVDKYNMDKQIIDKVQEKVKKKRDRKIKNIELYKKIYPLIEKQAEECLSDYDYDEVSYIKNGKIVSKQRLIRETYLDLEETYDKKGKKAIKEFDTDERLGKKLDSLTKNKDGELNKQKTSVKSIEKEKNDD